MSLAGMDDFFNPGGEYNSPVDVEATLSLLAATPPPTNFDFSGSLLSQTSYRTFQGAQGQGQGLGIPTDTQTYSITPPSSSSHAINTPSNKRAKRGRKDDAVPEEVVKGFDFIPFQAPGTINYPIFDTATMQPLNDIIELAVFKSGTNTHLSHADSSWICYRQNQFKVYCYLKSPACHMRVRDGAVDVDVHQFYAKLFAVKSSALGGIDEMPIGLFHAGKQRVKKEKTELVPIPFTDGRVEFTNLQFERSNAANKGQQEFFHLAVTLLARHNSAYYPVMSRVVIVRSQHPGFYGNTETNMSSSATSSEDTSSPKMMDENNWQQSGNNLFHMGKIGVNTSDPTEALTVYGTTGNYLKPSDRRIKSNFVDVNSNDQLDRIRDVKIYDYTIQDKAERGIIAQELQKIIPAAVHEAGDVNINGAVVPNLLVVNERSLLYETLGATQQIDKDLTKEKHTIIQIDKKVDDLATNTEKSNAELKDQIRSLTDVLFKEEISKREMGLAGIAEENVVFGLNLFHMGPTRSLMVLGYFYEYIWLVGALFVFSSLKSRRILARACLFKFVLWLIIFRVAATRRGPDFIPWISYAIGLTLLIGNFIRHKRRMKATEGDKESTGSSPKDWLYNCCTCMLGKTKQYTSEEDEREAFINTKQ